VAESEEIVTKEPPIDRRFSQVIYADAVANLAHGSQIAKFYLVRLDADPSGGDDDVTTVAAQIIMPLEGFLGSFVFLETIVNSMIEKGDISQEYMDEIRRRASE